MNIWKSYMWSAEWRIIWRKIIFVVNKKARTSLKFFYIFIWFFYIWFSYIRNFIIILSPVYNEPIQRPAPSWLFSLIGRALHRYRRGQGFESRTSLMIFCLSFVLYQLKVRKYVILAFRCMKILDHKTHPETEKDQGWSSKTLCAFLQLKNTVRFIYCRVLH